MHFCLTHKESSNISYQSHDLYLLGCSFVKIDLDKHGMIHHFVRRLGREFSTLILTTYKENSQYIPSETHHLDIRVSCFKRILTISASCPYLQLMVVW